MLKTLKQARAAFSLLSPDDIRKRAHRPVHIGLVAAGPAGYSEMEEFLVPAAVPRATRMETMKFVHRAGDPGSPSQVDLVLYQQGIPGPKGTYTFYREFPETTVCDILRGNDDLHLALARQFLVFRKPVIDKIILNISRENAFFAITTALPDIIPNLMELPWAFGEWATDTAFLTANQIRMAFLIAAACDQEVGLGAQKAQVLSIGAGAFGWRAIARELVGKIPLGGGLIPKGAIAWAGTYLVGKGLERLNHGNVDLLPHEHQGTYREALERGKEIAAALVPQRKS